MPTPLPLPARRPGLPPRHLADLPPSERGGAVAALGCEPFRARQLAQHYFGRLAAEPQAMTDLPGRLAEQLAAELLPPLLTEARSVSCDAGTTIKTLWRAHDGVQVESVVMRYRDRATVCVSSQAGCGMACPFCATGQGGLQRNLSTAEIAEQVRAAARMLAGGRAGPPARLTNVVFMGMGEPLANYRRTIEAVRRICDPVPHGFGISRRSVTLSTVGLVPAMRKLAGEGIAVTLAVSLHAPDDGLRDQLVPVNARWKIAEVLAAARAYAGHTGRRVSVEYALIRDVNDQPWRADLLGGLLHRSLGPLAHVNVIPLNPTPGSKWDAAPEPVLREFVRRVNAAGVSCTVRDTRGREIAAACGQLAALG
jgi:23S rRNA (adenine2503-C2)-methyltransferase